MACNISIQQQIAPVELRTSSSLQDTACKEYITCDAAEQRGAGPAHGAAGR